jgi:hypothetical protein
MNAGYPATIFYPHIVAPGATAKILLACGTSVTSDFTAPGHNPTSVKLCYDGYQGSFQYDLHSRRYVVVTQLNPPCTTLFPGSSPLPAQEIDLPLTNITGGTWFAIVSTPNGDFEISNTLVVR